MTGGSDEITITQARLNAVIANRLARLNARINELEAARPFNESRGPDARRRARAQAAWITREEVRHAE